VLYLSYAYPNLMVDACTYQTSFYSNSGAGSGAVTAVDTNLRVVNCSFASNNIVLPVSSNFTSVGGGALTVAGPSVTAVSGSVFKGNTADIGGALSARTGVIVQLINNDFEQNNADYGAAIFSDVGADVQLREVSASQLRTLHNTYTVHN
jgi:hypothetical protein